MKYDHGSPKPGRVREPVQVYLGESDRERLDRLTEQLDTSKSDVLRQALAALERELSDPEQHPILRMIALADRFPDRPIPPDVGYDVAREHDRFLADSEIASWSNPEDPSER